MIEAHIKETLTYWTREYFEAKLTERKILYEWGIFELLVNHSHLRTSLNPPHSSEY